MKTCPSCRPKPPDAFSRTELVVVCGVVALLASVAIPGLAQAKPRSQQAVCLNNLRIIGTAITTWNSEHANFDPWRYPEGGAGSGGGALANNSFIQFSWFSNNLPTARVLACPSDLAKRPADNFSAL